MLNTVKLYYFSPTGGTEKVGKHFAGSIAEKTVTIDLAQKESSVSNVDADLAVVAMPVFAGRIPGIIKERLPQAGTAGMRAVTMVVYGNRAYEDALLELNDAMEERGYEIIASAAFVAQHSIAPEIAAGRPDAEDLAEISAFAEAVEARLNDLLTDPGSKGFSVKVPGNRPYRAAGGGPNVIEVSAVCCACGLCAKICPSGAADLGENFAVTDSEKCIECMACIAHCPVKARSLPKEVSSRVEQFLAPLKDVRRENETFL